jgi:hypothetical protein
MSTTIEPIPETLESHSNVGEPFSWSQAKIEEQITARLESVRPIADSKGADDMTPAEIRMIKKVSDDVERLRDMKLVPHIGHPSPTPRFGEKLGGSFYNAIMKAGWDPVTKSRVNSGRGCALQGGHGQR